MEPTNISKLIYQDLRITTFITVVTAIGAPLYLYRSYCKLTLCKGFKYAKYCVLYLFITNYHFMDPIKLRSTSENLLMFTIEGELQSNQIGSTKNLMWDVLKINWHNVKIHHQQKPSHLHQDISTDLKGRSMVYRTINTGSYNVHIMINSANWYPLENRNITLNATIDEYTV